MIQERMIKTLVLAKVFEQMEYNQEYKKFIQENYDVDKMYSDYSILGEDFLREYALK